MISGILPVDKPAGWTSHDVVARLRRVAGQKAVGHAGTLDPLATGVLIVMLGGATKLSQYLVDSRKVYCACVALGATTLTDDAEAPLEARCSIDHLRREDIENVLQTFVGTIQQLPPRYAAVKQEGQKLYQMARKGVDVERSPRTVVIHRLDLVECAPPRLTVRVECGPGTYVRSLARDIGAQLGVGGYLHALRRTGSGTFHIFECVPLETLETRSDVLVKLQPADRAVLSWNAAVIEKRGVDDLRQGRPAKLEGDREGNLRVYDDAGTLVALCTLSGGVARPFRVFDGGR